MFSKYDGVIINPKQFDSEVNKICKLISEISDIKKYNNILQYLNNI